MKDLHYSIKDLENLTGIKAHTIRIWEQRYHLFNPKRTDTNIRYYTDEDVKKILNVNLLYSNGYKISKIAQLNEEQFLAEVQYNLSDNSHTGAKNVDKLLTAVMSLDEQAVQRILSDSVEQHKVMGMYAKLVIPTLQKIGELWQVNSLSVGHEHFFSNQLKRFMNVKIDELNVNPTKSKIILYLPENEEHEISLMFYHYYLKSQGCYCYYLGQNLPLSDLAVLYEQINPDYVVTSFITHMTKKNFKSHLDDLLKIIEPSKLILSGSLVFSCSDIIPTSIRIISKEDDLNNIFK